MKAFEPVIQQELKQPEALKRDPYLFTNDVIEQEITTQVHRYSELNAKIVGFVGFLFAPLNTISIALQTSVKAHQHIHSETPRKPTQSKSLEVKKTSITLAEKRKLELLIRSGSTHKPYTAPVYDGIVSAAKGLWSQGGVQGLYKGGMMRFFINTVCTYYQWFVIYDAYKESKLRASKPSLGFFLAGFVDILFNVFYIVEARSVLQNRLPHFRTFKRFYHTVKRHECLTGGTVHLYTGAVNMVAMAAFIKLQGSELTLIGTLLLNRLLVYPVLTAYRRVICQSPLIGMIPVRYSSIWHCLRLTTQEQGLQSLYKGFSVHYLYTLLLSFSLLSGVTHSAYFTGRQ